MSQQALALDFEAYEDAEARGAREQSETREAQANDEQVREAEIPLEYEVVPRATIAAMVRERNEAVAAFEEAWERTHAAEQAIESAWRRAAEATRDEYLGYSARRSGPDAVLKAECNDRERCAEQVRKIVDGAMWRRIIAMTQLETLMDATAKEALHSEIQVSPPAITEENIEATIETFLGQSRTIFMRGIATCFSGLDRRFRSHLGFKIGHRIILENSFNEYGDWGCGQWHRRKRDTLIDVDRTFHVLDGRGNPQTYGGIVGAIDAERGRGRMTGARQSEVESDYFKVQIYKNGNAHVWFKREDLVDAVNRLLAEYYGETLADATNQRREDAKGREGGRSKAMAKNFGFFATPDDVADRVIENARLHRREGKPGPTVLEPSAGTGALARRAAERGATVDCVEIQPEMARVLRAQDRYHSVVTGDFLEQVPGPGRTYDVVVMNPPFDNGLDIDHVRHALRFLKENGRLVAIVSAACEFRETHAAKAFRRDLERLNAAWVDIPAGAFSAGGTNVNTVMIVANADATPPGWSVKRWR